MTYNVTIFSPITNENKYLINQSIKIKNQIGTALVIV